MNFDFRNVEFNSWVYALLFNVQDQYVLRDVANGKKATALGMWCYVPEGFCNPAGDTSGALSMQLTVYKNPQGTSGTQLNFQFYSENQKKKVSRYPRKQMGLSDRGSHRLRLLFSPQSAGYQLS